MRVVKSLATGFHLATPPFCRLICNTRFVVDKKAHGKLLPERRCIHCFGTGTYSKYAEERKIKFHLLFGFFCILRRGNSVSSKEGTAKSPSILFPSYPLRHCGEKNASRDAATLAMQRGVARPPCGAKTGINLFQGRGKRQVSRRAASEGAVRSPCSCA